MAKPTTIKIRLNSTAGTGHFYVTKKNARTMTEKMVMKKYDPVVRKRGPFSFAVRNGRALAPAWCLKRFACDVKRTPLPWTTR